MSAGRQSGPGAAPRLSELKNRVEQATRLIAELREANYSLTGELAELRRKVKSLESEARSRVAAGAAPEATDESLHEELQLLRDERKIIRARVQNLLERIEKIDL